MRLADVTKEALETIFAPLADEADAVVSQAAPGAPMSHRMIAEMRYEGQGHQLRVPLDSFDREAIGKAFSATYAAAYGYAYDDLAPEIVTLRLSAVADQPTASVTGGATVAEVAPGTRDAWDPVSGAMQPHRVLPFDTLSGTVDGPALLAQPGTTILIGAGARAQRMEGGWLEITVKDAT